MTSWGQMSTLGKTSMGLQGGGAIMGAYSAYQRAKTKKATYGYNAGVAHRQADYANYMARDAAKRGAWAMSQQLLKTGQMHNAQRAGFAAGNVDTSTGSAANVMHSTDLLGHLDALTLQHNAMNQAKGYAQQGAMYQGQANLDNAMGNAISPLHSAFSSLLGSASSIASSWLAM